MRGLHNIYYPKFYKLLFIVYFMFEELITGANQSLNPKIFIIFIGVIIIIAIWEAIWKIIAMWKSARNNQFYWFLACALLNTLGILPIIYILYFQKKNPEKKVIKKEKRRKK